MKTKILIGLIITTLVLVSVMYTSAAGMQQKLKFLDDNIFPTNAPTEPDWFWETIAPTSTPPPPEPYPAPEPYPMPVPYPMPYPAPEQELIMKSEQWILLDGAIQIFSAP